jgi:hypothetical protein
VRDGESSDSPSSNGRVTSRVTTFSLSFPSALGGKKRHTTPPPLLPSALHHQHKCNFRHAHASHTQPHRPFRRRATPWRVVSLSPPASTAHTLTRTVSLSGSYPLSTAASSSRPPPPPTTIGDSPRPRPSTAPPPSLTPAYWIAATIITPNSGRARLASLSFPT